MIRPLALFTLQRKNGQRKMGRGEAAQLEFAREEMLQEGARPFLNEQG
jgi:hypothetical protein